MPHQIGPTTPHLLGRLHRTESVCQPTRHSAQPSRPSCVPPPISHVCGAHLETSTRAGCCSTPPASRATALQEEQFARTSRHHALVAPPPPPPPRYVCCVSFAVNPDLKSSRIFLVHHFCSVRAGPLPGPCTARHAENERRRRR